MGQKDKSSHLILVVDDNEAIRGLLNAFLSDSGYNVIEACDGLEAIKVAKSECPDLIIMDLSMPVMDGFGAVRVLREVLEVREVPVIACTALDTTTHRVQALEVGFNEILPKPIDFNRLDSLLEQYLKAA
jgi:two-component system cell cycle response regulator DivK